MRNRGYAKVVKLAIRDTRKMLPTLAQLGLLRDGVEDDSADRHMRTKACIELRYYAAGRGQLSADVQRHLLQSQIVRPPVRKVRQKNAVRDQLLVIVISHIEKRGITPTRNREGQYICGCSLVATTLGKLGINISARGVEAIWNKRHSAHPYVPPLIPLTPPVRDI